MKMIIMTLLLILGGIVVTSCNNDDDSIQETPINGTWNLKNSSGGITGIDQDYENGKIIWTFNNQDSLLNIANNSIQDTGNQIFVNSGLKSGEYPYSIVKTNGNEYILINTAEYGKIIISGNNLSINQNEHQSGSGNDGFLLQFEK